jgi:hypothetical protein
VTSAGASEALEAMEDAETFLEEARPLSGWELAGIIVCFLFYLAAVIALGVGLVAV